MGYTTEFSGELDFNRPLTVPEYNELCKMAEESDPDLLAQYTDTPETIPSSYLQWVPTKDGMGLEWDGGEKFYEYIHWLRWLIKHYFKPRDIVLNGEIRWSGEDVEDVGILKVVDNKVTSEKLRKEILIDCPHCGERIYKDEE